MVFLTSSSASGLASKPRNQPAMEATGPRKGPMSFKARLLVMKDALNGMKGKSLAAWLVSMFGPPWFACIHIISSVLKVFLSLMTMYKMCDLIQNDWLGEVGGPLKSSTMKCGLFPTCWSHPLRATNINKLYLRSCWPLVVVLPQPNELRKSPAPQWPRSGWNLLPPGGWQPRDSFAQGGVPSAALQIKKSDD